MKFDLDNLNPGTFFEFEDDDGGVTIRLANSDAMREIDKATVKKKISFHRGQRYEVDVVDEALRSNMIWDYIIIDWENVTDSNGVDIPCTFENKAKLMRESVKFSSFIASCVEQLTDNMSLYEEELEKN